jgi:hypothetical protein
MRTFHCLSIICISLGLVGCEAMTQMHRESVARHCVTSAAYNEGLKDGLTPGVNPERNYAADCPTNNNQLNMAYLNGFAHGMRSRPMVINANVAMGTTPLKTVPTKMRTSSQIEDNIQKQMPVDPFPRYRTDWSMEHDHQYQTHTQQKDVSQSPVQKSGSSW